MVFNPHIRVTIEGHFGEAAVPAEIWSTSFAMATLDEHTATPPDLPDTAELETYAGDIGGAWGAADSKMPAGTFLDRVKVALINADGHVALSAGGAYYQRVHNYSPPVAGHVTQPPYPFQIAWCLSLHTGAAGRHAKGRMYLPPPTILSALGSNGLMNVSDRAWMLSFGQVLLVGAEVAFEAKNLGVHVAGSDASNRRVTTLLGGRVYDTQRRRRNALNEDYVAETLGG